MVLSFSLCSHNFLIRMAKKRNTTLDDLDVNARQSMKESIESQSTSTTTSDNSDNAQEPPNVESEGSPNMIGIPNSLQMETPVKELETSPGNEEGEESVSSNSQFLHNILNFLEPSIVFGGGDGCVRDTLS